MSSKKSVAALKGCTQGEKFRINTSKNENYMGRY